MRVRKFARVDTTVFFRKFLIDAIVYGGRTYKILPPHIKPFETTISRYALVRNCTFLYLASAMYFPVCYHMVLLWLRELL